MFVEFEIRFCISDDRLDRASRMSESSPQLDNSIQ